MSDKMTGMQEAAREQWGSRLGFILAAMGSAVGLGNVWRFSYMTGENGGAAFLIIYLACVFLLGVPIILAEFTIGRRAQSDAVGSFEKIAPKKPWYIAGFMGVLAAFMILSFYAVIAGWTMKYFFSYLTGAMPKEGIGDFFGGFITSSAEPLIWQFVFMALTAGVVLVGVKKGIEKANLILMPFLGVLLIGLAIYSMSLGGTKEALTFLFKPDWSAFTNPEIYIGALGQAFFSLSLGMGALITYGSYLSKKEKLPSAALSVATLDTSFALVAGLVIFPAVFAFGVDPAEGVGLAFVVLPEIFAQMGAGTIVGLAFFFLLFAAALSSAISLLEVPVAYFMRKFEWSRKKATLILGGIVFLLGVPSSLSLGVWSSFTLLPGKGVLDSMDFISGSILLPLGGLVIALFLGWGWKKADALQASDMSEGLLTNLWIFSLRYLSPVAIVLIFLSKIGVFGG
jgi:neurotransmitter:Na+ symporter, NSS family